VRKRVSIFFLNQPDFSKYACEYLILKLNTLQSAFEFEVDGMVFDENNHFSSETSHVSTQLLDAFNSALQASPNKPKKDQYYIGIGRMGIDPKNDLFYTIRDNMAIITTQGWQKTFSPPSVFEYILSSLAGTLIQLSLRMNGTQNITYHEQSRGCLNDYTEDKQENRVDVLLGYVCDSCKERITQVLGAEMLSSLQLIASHDWIGETSDPQKAAYYVKKYFKVDLNKDSGFNKTAYEQLRDGLPGLARDILIAVVPTVIGIVITLWLTHAL
jgi:hypothetical protein